MPARCRPAPTVTTPAATTVLNDKILHIFIELPKFADRLEDLQEDSTFLSKFAVAMKTMSSCEERPSVMDDDMLVRMFDAADLHSYKNNDKHNYKKSVMNEFEYEETLKEYRQEGLEEGIQKGSDNRNIEVATRMLKDGVDIEIISKYTDLSKDEILALKP